MSLIFWILSIVVLVKYVTIVLHANDNGEGEHCSCIWQRVVCLLTKTMPLLP